MKNRFQEARAQAPDCLTIIASRPPVYQQHDVSYDYEPGALFRWLTRSDAHPCVLAMTPDGQLHAFLNEHDPIKWLWEGPQVDTQHIHDIQADQVHSIKKLENWLAKQLNENHSVLFDWDDHYLADKITQAQSGRQEQHEKTDLGPIIRQLRSRKDAWEIEQIRHAIALSVQSHLELMRHAHLDPHETAIQGRFLLTGYQSGIRSLAYPPIIASGANAVTLHYHHNNSIPKASDWLLVDAGWRYHGYCSDLTRSYPLNKQANGLRKEIYQLVLKTQQAAISQLKPGVSWKLLNSQARDALAAGLVDLGLLTASTRNNISQYFPHGLGHWLGLEVHDPNPYRDDKQRDVSWEKGMVVTIEPGLYFPSNANHLPEELRGFGIRIEDNILITDSGCENLSQALPVALDDIARV